MVRLLAALALLFATAAHAACRVEARASVPVTLVQNQATVPVALNGQDTPMLLDTGAGRTLLTAAAVQRENLPQDEWVSTPLRGAGNRIEEHRNVILTSMALGGLKLQRRGLAQSISLAVTGQRLDPQGRIAGLLGADLLSRYDLDLDLPAGRLMLYSVTACAGRYLPWTSSYDAIPARILPDNALVVQVLIDGRTLDAQLDTGAGASLIDARGLHRLGLTPAALAHDSTSLATGIGGQFLDQRHRFSELRIGAERIVSPTIRVAALPRPGVDMLLGMDVLASRRIWISYATAQLFIGTP
jgi:predicted aspartyl protease